MRGDASADENGGDTTTSVWMEGLENVAVSASVSPGCSCAASDAACAVCMPATTLPTPASDDELAEEGEEAAMAAHAPKTLLDTGPEALAPSGKEEMEASTVSAEACAAGDSVTCGAEETTARTAADEAPVVSGEGGSALMPANSWQNRRTACQSNAGQAPGVVATRTDACTFATAVRPAVLLPPLAEFATAVRDDATDWMRPEETLVTGREETEDRTESAEFWEEEDSGTDGAQETTANTAAAELAVLAAVGTTLAIKDRSCNKKKCRVRTNLEDFRSINNAPTSERCSRPARLRSCCSPGLTPRWR